MAGALFCVCGGGDIKAGDAGRLNKQVKKKRLCHRAESEYPAGSSIGDDEFLSSVLDNTTHSPYDELMQLWGTFSFQLIRLR